MRTLLAVATLSGAMTAVASTSVALAATVLTVSGSTLLVSTPMEHELQGALCRAPNTCEKVDYPAGGIGQGPLDQGEVALQDKIAATSGDKIVMAYSQGGIIATQWLEQHAGQPDAPPASDLTFVLFGNPQRAEGGLGPASGGGRSNTPTPTDTPYSIVDVSRQYDLLSDWPTDPTNGLAVANALAGYLFVHTDYTGVDVNSPDNLVKKVGNTTYVLAPTANLPLLEPLRRVGLGGAADALNAPLKKVVDAGYDRSGYTPLTSPVLPTGSAETSVAAVSPRTPTAASGIHTGLTKLGEAAIGARPRRHLNAQVTGGAARRDVATPPSNGKRAHAADGAPVKAAVRSIAHALSKRQGGSLQRKG